MTEKEKMLQGILYNANFDEELLKEREVLLVILFLEVMKKPKIMLFTEKFL